jgi:hypothetical protein
MVWERLQNSIFSCVKLFTLSQTLGRSECLTLTEKGCSRLEICLSSTFAKMLPFMAKSSRFLRTFFYVNPCFLTNSLARVNNPYLRESVRKTMVASVMKSYKFRTLIIVELWKEEFWNLGADFLEYPFHGAVWCVSNMCQMSFICLIFGDRGCQRLDVFLIGN